MSLPEDKLIGWICMIRLALSNGQCPFVPTLVQEALCKRGWLEVNPEVDWDDRHEATVTDEGALISDLAAPEWGIDPIPADEPA